MARYVDHAHGSSISQIEPRKAKFDGDAAFLLLNQAIGVGPRQGEYEGRFAVVDMPGSSQDQIRLRVVGHDRSLLSDSVHRTGGQGGYPNA